MIDRRKLHPVYMLFALLQTVKGLLPVIIITLLRGTKLSQLNPYWYIGIGGVILLLLVYGYYDWRKFSYVLEHDRIVIHKGVLFRDEKTIYFSRIHSVNVEQPLIQRLLGVAQLNIETPGGNKKAEGVLSALSAKDAEKLRTQLLGSSGKAAVTEAAQTADASPEAATHLLSETAKEKLSTGVPAEEGARYRLKGGQLLMAGLTSMNFGLVVAFVAGLISFADDFIRFIVPDHFYENIAQESKSLMGDYLSLILVAVGALLLAWLLSSILFLVKFAGFEVRMEGKRVAVSYGLLDKKTHVFDPRKVQAVIIEENLLQQMAGYAKIKLQVISSDKNERLVLHPFIAIGKLQEVLGSYVPHLKVQEADNPAPKRALLYYMRGELIIAAIFSAVLIFLFKGPGLLSLVLLPIVAYWCWARYKTAGIGLENGQLTLRKRYLSRITYYIRRPQIVVMNVRRTRWQQRKRLYSLSVNALGSEQEYSVSCLDQAAVEPVWEWYSRDRK
ncbi:PH domain-containing protein [Paenibacillus gorillae]|uniref:PH domain-containing protein n=1 Tax=Paenibacillus gorillae TaxID=1243662 RepID=UPI0004BC18C8|nr:PH domain-containing protein [Paenibacillus gorillae]